MIICAAGDTHGAIDLLYENVLTFEKRLGVRFAHLLHVGDFGVWPDPARLDRATRDHDGAGDFPSWIASGREAPRPTTFIKGNHEDFEWLGALANAEVLPGVTYLRNAEVSEISEGPETLRIVGLGGCYGPSNYDREARQLSGYGRRHYTRDEVERAAGRKDVDVLLLHDAPAGVRFDGRSRHYVSEAAGLDDVVARLRPRVCFFGHHHVRLDADVHGVRCIGLNKVGRPGHLVAIEVDARDGTWSCLGES
jgi:Icc-related predicted phosphoesterase